MSAKDCSYKFFELRLQLLESGKEVGAVYFDFRKVFDSVPHCALLKKLEDLQVNEHILNWIQYYLKGGFASAGL